MIKKSLVTVSVILSFVALGWNVSMAEQKRDMGGWEKDSTYNKLYDYTEMDSFKGWVVKIREIIPLPGMSPGVAVEISETKNLKSEPIIVHLCPTWFADGKTIGIKRGDRVKVKGVWAEIDGEAFAPGFLPALRCVCFGGKPNVCGNCSPGSCCAWS